MPYILSAVLPSTLPSLSHSGFPAVVLYCCGLDISCPKPVFPKGPFVKELVLSKAQFGNGGGSRR